VNQPRCKAVAIERHGGRDVVIVEDTAAELRHAIYLRNGRYLHWRNDEPVRDRTLQRVVREVLEEERVL
jgi:hypothetical protein